jgi:hypothetical protein
MADALLRALGTNADQRITDAQARAYAESVVEQSTLTLDDVDVPWSLESISVPPYQNLKLASGTIRIYTVAKRPDRAGAHILSYENRYRPAKSQWIANILLQPDPGWRYEVTGQQRSDDGRRLTVRYTGAHP